MTNTPSLNGILVIDKPKGFTSHDVVAKLRGMLRERRIGHGGTLDPIATGVLPVFIGRATRASSLLLESDKSYIARFRLGIVTDTDDITGTVLARSDEIPTPGSLSAVYPRFVGTLEQRPPLYSALKIGGRKLYEIARSGESVEVPARMIEIYSIEDHGAVDDDYEIQVFCSKGTYIRALIRDIGALLGCGATLTELRRIATGPFDLSNARTLEEVQQSVLQGDAQKLLHGVDTLFSIYPFCMVDEAGEALCRNGALIPFPDLLPGQSYRVYNASGDFLMLGVAVLATDRTFLKTVKNFFDVGNGSL